MPEQPVMPIPDGSVVITPAQQYAELRALTTAVEKLTNTMDPALADMRKDIDDNAGAIKDIRLELAGLTKFRYVTTGVVTILVLLIGWGALNLNQIGG